MEEGEEFHYLILTLHPDADDSASSMLFLNHNGVDTYVRVGISSCD